MPAQINKIVITGTGVDIGGVSENSQKSKPV
jgi:hypothetical protein